MMKLFVLLIVDYFDHLMELLILMEQYLIKDYVMDVYLIMVYLYLHNHQYQMVEEEENQLLVQYELDEHDKLN